MIGYARINGIRQSLHAYRERETDPAAIEALCIAIDALDDVLVEIVRADPLPERPYSVALHEARTTNLMEKL